MCVRAQPRQLCPTLCDPLDCGLSGSLVHGILQARTLEWVAMSSSRDWTCVSWVSCIASRFFAHWATWEPMLYVFYHNKNLKIVARIQPLIISTASRAPYLPEPVLPLPPESPVLPATTWLPLPHSDQRSLCTSESDHVSPLLRTLHGSHLFFFSHSVAKSRLTLCDSMDCSTPGFPVLHCLPGFAQTYVHRVNDIIQPSHPLPPSSPFAFNLSQHQGLF